MTVSLEHPEGRAPSPAVAADHHAGHGRRAPGAVATSDGPGAEPTLRVSVLVHGATGLDSGGCRRAARRVRRREDHARGGGTPAVARGDARGTKSRDPVWDEVVSVEVTEQDLDREKVLLAVVNHDTNKLMAKAAVPLKALEVGRHYGLALDLGAATLNITVVIPQAPARGSSSSSRSTPTTCGWRGQSPASRATPGGVRGAGGGCVVGVVGQPSRARGAVQQEGGAVPQSQRGLRERRGERPGENGVGLQVPGRRAGAAGLELAGPPLWPTGHRAALFVSRSAIAMGGALVLELVNSAGMICRAVVPVADLGAGGRPTELNHVPLICGGDRRGRRGPRRGGWQGFADGCARGRASRCSRRARSKSRRASTAGAGWAWAARARGC